MKRIPEEMENLILEMLQQGKTYKAIVARTGVSESTVGRVARDNGICRIKRDIENEENNYPQELMEEWDRVRLEILANVARGERKVKRIPEEMENLILEMLQQGKTYKAIVARTGVSESTVGRVARDNGICRIKRDIENEENNYPQELMEEWDRVRLEILAKG